MREISDHPDTKTILITGATGLVGTHCSHLLVNNGYQVRCLVRKTSDRSRLPEGIEFVYGDLSNEESLKDGVDGCWGVMHIGGLVKAKRPDDFFKINRDGTLLLTKAARNAGVKRFLLCSSQAAAGPSSANKRTKPSDNPAPVTIYGKSKLAGETALRENAGEMWWCVVRPPAVYGPYDTSFLPLVKGIQKRIKISVGSGVTCSMIHVSDLSKAFMLAIDSRQPAGRTWFATDGEDHTDQQISLAIEKALGRKALNIRIPVRLAESIGSMVEVYGRLSGSTVFFTREKVKELTNPYYTCDDSDFREATGYVHQFDLEEGMKLTVEWYRKHKWI